MQQELPPLDGRWGPKIYLARHYLIQKNDVLVLFSFLQQRELSNSKRNKNEIWNLKKWSVKIMIQTMKERSHFSTGFDLVILESQHSGQKSPKIKENI